MDKNAENLIDQKIDDLALAMHKGFEDIDKRMATKEDLEELRRDMERKSQERHNELMNSNDKLIRIFEASQQEFASSKFITDKQEERLENLEKRVGVLELQKAV